MTLEKALEGLSHEVPVGSPEIAVLRRAVFAVRAAQLVHGQTMDGASWTMIGKLFHEFVVPALSRLEEEEP